MMNGTVIPPIPINAIGSFNGFAPSRSISLNHASFSFSLVSFFGPSLPSCVARARTPSRPRFVTRATPRARAVSRFTTARVVRIVVVCIVTVNIVRVPARASAVTGDVAIGVARRDDFHFRDAFDAFDGVRTPSNGNHRTRDKKRSTDTLVRAPSRQRLGSSGARVARAARATIGAIAAHTSTRAPCVTNNARAYTRAESLSTSARERGEKRANASRRDAH